VIAPAFQPEFPVTHASTTGGPRRRRLRVAAGAVLAAGLALLPWGTGGCAILGVGVAKFSGPTRHPPAHVLAPVPTMVYVDRRENFGAVAADAQRIAQQASDLLRAGKSSAPGVGDGLVSVVDPGRAVEIRSRTGPDGRRPTPAEVAAACGASQFVYVEITVYDYTPAVAGQTTEGRVEAKVWVVDTKTGDVRWPPEANQGHPVSAALPATPLANAADDAALRGRMDEELALKIARLFTGWSEE
jgi:hypothetical protein